MMPEWMNLLDIVYNKKQVTSSKYFNVACYLLYVT